MTPAEEAALLKVGSCSFGFCKSTRRSQVHRQVVSGQRAICCMQEFFMDMRDVDRDNEVNRILGAFKLNPFEQLGINFDCTMEDIRRQYRKVSLMVHPDKCKHPRATDAFEVLGNANKSLTDEEHVRELRHALTLARGECSSPSSCAPNLRFSSFTSLLHPSSLPCGREQAQQQFDCTASIVV